MANAIYDKAREGFMSKAIDMVNDTIKVMLLDTNGGTPYAFSQAHQFLSDVVAGSRVGAAQALTAKSVTSGIFNAGNVNFGNTSGQSVEAFILYQDTGVEGTSRLIAYVDSGVTGLPVTPNGGPITITWDTGANKIFKL